MALDRDVLRTIANPYKPENEIILSGKQFIGREQELLLIDTLIREYHETGKLENILLVGVKTIGKTVLLEQFEQKLSSSFAIYHKELSKQEPQDITEFFVSLIDELINQFAENYSANTDLEKDSIFEPKQVEIWKSLIYQGEHGSKFINRKLTLATTFSKRESAREESILKDMRFVVDSLRGADLDVNGLVIVIDEFQELRNNGRLLEILTRLTREISNLTVIGAGLPLILDDVDTFEKFSRASRLIELRKFDKNEIREAIFAPVAEKIKCSIFAVREIFSEDCLRVMETRTDGNPYHIRILCSEMFDHFQNNVALERCEINSEVMEKVMIQYSRLSLKSKIIRYSLMLLTSSGKNWAWICLCLSFGAW